MTDHGGLIQYSCESGVQNSCCLSLKLNFIGIVQKFFQSYLGTMIAQYVSRQLFYYNVWDGLQLLLLFYANFTHYSVFLTNSDEWIHYGLVLTMFVVAFVITVGLLWVVLITLRVRSKYGDPKIHRGNTYIQTNQYIFPVYISLK